VQTTDHPLSMAACICTSVHTLIRFHRWTCGPQITRCLWLHALYVCALAHKVSVILWTCGPQITRCLWLHALYVCALAHKVSVISWTCGPQITRCLWLHALYVCAHAHKTPPLEVKITDHPLSMAACICTSVHMLIRCQSFSGCADHRSPIVYGCMHLPVCAHAHKVPPLDV